MMSLEFKNEIERILSFLENGKTILCPTDTIWGISCDATNFDAVEEVYKIKKREKSKSLIILVDSLEMLEEYIAEIPENISSLIKNHPKPLTIIYPNAKNLASNVYAEDKSIAIRIVTNGFCNELISSFGKPIVSTSANFSTESTATTFEEISNLLKEKVDATVSEKFGNKKAEASTIIKIENNEIITIRA